MEILNFHILIPQRCEKAHFEKLQDGMMQGRYILSIRITTKKKNDIKSKDRINTPFHPHMHKMSPRRPKH